MARKKFLRGKWRTYSKLGRGRKKKQKYRRATGRHNKIRENKKGNPKKVRIGYKKSERNKVSEVKIIVNIRGLSELGKGIKIMLGKIGKKKKIEIVKKAKELGVKIQNINIEKFLKKIEKEREEKIKKAEEEKARKAKEKKREKKAETKHQEKKESLTEKKKEESKKQEERK